MSKNPLSFLGLRRKGDEAEPDPEEPKDQDKKTSKGGLELNRRGVPARKRKLNSLIYGTDDLVSIPVKSPKKRGPKTPVKSSSQISAPIDPESNADSNSTTLASPLKSIAEGTSTKSKAASSPGPKSGEAIISLFILILTFFMQNCVISLSIL